MTLGEPTFRSAVASDWIAIWPIFRAVVASGDTYMFAPDIDEDTARRVWMLDDAPRSATFVAEIDGRVVGTAILKPNATGRGDHVANAAWMISATARGQGLGRRFAIHVIEHATSLGFRGMQFNAVVATNSVAIALWRSLGFEIVGTVPRAFRHARDGLVSIHVMYRDLGRPPAADDRPPHEHRPV